MLRPAILLAALALAGAMPFPAAAQSLDLPARRAGHWEIRIVTEKPAGAPTMDTQVCLDAATDRELMEFGLRISKDACSRFDMKRTGGNLVIDSQCTFGPVSSTTRTIMSGDFQTTYTIRIEGKTDGLPLSNTPKGPQDMSLVQTARWTGATCPDGMKPGDFTLPGGMKFNIKQARKLQKMLPNIQIR
jgi:Protein of unknown function (DUF3617)